MSALNNNIDGNTSDITKLLKDNKMKAFCYAGCRVYSDSKPYAFDTLCTLSEIQSHLGYDINAGNMVNKIAVYAGNGDWNANQIYVTQAAIQPNTQNVVVLYNQAPSGYRRVNYIVMRID